MEEKIGGICLHIFGQSSEVYNEGDDVETRVLESLRNGRDPLAVLEDDSRWPILYQLSPERCNLTEVMDLQAEDTVLELGAGMGAITGAVAARCRHVDCVELSLRRSRANAWRNRDKDNISIYVGNLEHFIAPQKYDVVLLIGVLEYAAVYMTCADPFHTMLKLACSFLKPGGKAYIAIENRLGMKYFAGCSEDHIGKPFVGIEGYDGPQKVRTFTHSELESMIRKSGFSSVYFYYPLPDYKLPSVIFSDDFLKDRQIPAWHSESFDQDRLITFDDVKALKCLPDEEFKILANSFLVEAQK